MPGTGGLTRPREILGTSTGCVSEPSPKLPGSRLLGLLSPPSWSAPVGSAETSAGPYLVHAAQKACRGALQPHFAGKETEAQRRPKLTHSHTARDLSDGTIT